MQAFHHAQEIMNIPGSLQSSIIPIISGTFTSLPLYIILFSTLNRTLTTSSIVPAHGPHQYLALSPGGGMLYATSWGVPAKLWSWEVGVGQGGGVELKEKGSTGITAVSSYITTTSTHIYSIGGPTGEIHLRPSVSESTGFGEKIQEMVYVPEDELKGWDKTNKALRYGTHAIEFGQNGRAYVPDLGLNCIHIHQLLPSGHLEYVTKVMSPRKEDGPRHVVVSKDGKRVYAVTEHTQFLDVYDATEEGLEWVHSASLIPEGHNPHDYRGDTLRLSKSTSHVFATTRGKDSSVRGYLVAFSLDPSGHLTSPSSAPAATYQTPTSGGKANAIEVTATNGRGKEGELDWIVLTDGEEGFVMVLGWDGERFEEVDRVELEEGDMASHAIWLD